MACFKEIVHGMSPQLMRSTNMRRRPAGYPIAVQVQGKLVVSWSPTIGIAARCRRSVCAQRAASMTLPLELANPE
jgi:hypothetical protein